MHVNTYIDNYYIYFYKLDQSIDSTVRLNLLEGYITVGALRANLNHTAFVFKVKLLGFTCFKQEYLEHGARTKSAH